MTKLKKSQIVTKLERSNCNQTQKLKSCKTKKLNWDNSKTQIVIVIKMTVVTEVVIMTSFSKNTLTPWQPNNSQGSFSQFLWCFVKEEKKTWHDMWQVTGDWWQVTGDRWQVTHDTWHMTHSVGWTFSQNFRSLALLVWDCVCLEDILTKGWLT